MDDKETRIRQNNSTSVAEVEDSDTTPFLSATEDISQELKSDDELVIKDIEKALLLNNWQTSMHILKGNIGTGILGLPAAVKHSGLIVGPICLGLLAIVAVHCMHLLVICSHAMCKRSSMKSCDYGQVTEEIVTEVYGAKYGFRARCVLDTFICATQLGFCCVYFVFVAENLHQLFGLMDIRYWTLICFAPVLLLSMIRELQTIAYLSAIANVLCLIGLIGTYQYLFFHLRNVSDFPPIAPPREFPLFFGIAVFAYEGIGIVLPVENRMKKPKDFFFVLDFSMSVVAVLFVSMGFFGYLAFGDEVKGSVTLNLPQLPFYVIVKASYMMAIFFTYFIQFYVPMQIMIPPLQKGNEKCRLGIDVFMRTAMVMLTCALAITIPQLDNFIALVGAVSGASIALVFPPILHTLCFWKEGISKLEITKNIMISVFGIAGSILGTILSIEAIIEGFGKELNSNEMVEPKTPVGEFFTVLMAKWNSTVWF